MTGAESLLPSALHCAPFRRPVRKIVGHASHAITRFLHDEAFVLSTKERVPYLVFVEAVRLQGPEPWSSASPADWPAFATPVWQVDADPATLKAMIDAIR